MDEVEKKVEEPQVEEQPKKVKQNKGNRVMTPERIENLRKAREKASLLRKQLREVNVEVKTPTKLEVKLEKIKLSKNKDEPSEPTTEPTHDKPMDKHPPKRTEHDVPKMEEPQQEDTRAENEKQSIPDKQVKRVPEKEEPKLKPTQSAIFVKEEKKPPLYRREGKFLYI
tara:strand:+ start:39 stop:545 length:507 start_codon:yes stop_codon:yes gene_type:complete